MGNRILGAICIAAFAGLLGVSSTHAQPPGKGGKNKGTAGGKLVGTRWEYDVKKNGMVIEEGKFVATPDFKIMHVGVQIGTYSQTGKGQYKLEIEKGKLKGKITLNLIKKQPKEVYRGEFEMAEGGKANITVTFLKD